MMSSMISCDVVHILLQKPIPLQNSAVFFVRERIADSPAEGVGLSGDVDKAL